MSYAFMSWGCGSQLNEKSLVNISFTRLKFSAPAAPIASGYSNHPDTSTSNVLSGELSERSKKRR